MVCFVIGMVCLLKDNEFVWRIMILFLFITCMIEIGTIPMKKIYLANPIPENSNAWVFNILLLFQMIFFNLMFVNLFDKYVKSKPIILGGLALFSLSYISELFLLNHDGIFDYNSITDAVMSVLFVLYSLYYYYLLFKDDQYLDLKYSPSFWWVSGTLFFYFGSITCTLFYEILKAQPNANKTYLSYITNILIIILYSCWSYAFICKKWLTPI